MTLPNVILFPQAMLPLFIFEIRYRHMLRDALNSHRMFCVAMQKPGRTREIPAPVAGLGLIRAAVTNSNGTSNLILQGVTRVQLAEAVQYKPYRIHRVRPIETQATDSVVVDALVAKVRDLVTERLEQGFQVPVQLVKKLAPLDGAPLDSLSSYTLEHILKFLTTLDDPDQIADIVSFTLLSVAEERQVILETVDVEHRLKHLIHFLMAEISRHGKQSEP